jgi:hypothetical protein
MSEVAREWQDREGAQHYASTAVVRLASKPKRAHPKSKEGASNYNATTEEMLWPDPLILILAVQV